MLAPGLPPTRDVHSAFMSPVLPPAGSHRAHHAIDHRAARRPLASPGLLSTIGNDGVVVSSWAHLSESMLELDRALESPLFFQSPALSRGTSPPSRALTPPLPPHFLNVHHPAFSRDKQSHADSALLKTILIPCELSPKHVSFDDGIQKQAAAAQHDAVALSPPLFDQTLKYIRSSARSALSTFDPQAPSAVVAPSAPATDTQSSHALFLAEEVRVSPEQSLHSHPRGRERAAVSDTMFISDLSFPAGSGVFVSSGAPVRGGVASAPARHVKQLIDPFMCVSSRGLSHLLARAGNLRLMSSCWRSWHVFVVSSGNAKVLKLETRLQELQTSFSSLQTKYSLVCSSEFSKRISTEHLRWSATELSGASIAAVSKSGGSSNPVVTRFERIVFKANSTLRVRTTLRCFHSWFMLAMRHRQLRSCYNIVSGRRGRRLMGSVIFRWHRGAHMQSKSRLIYPDREESDDTRQLHSQLARQEKMIEALRETNRKLELDLRRMVRAELNP